MALEVGSRLGHYDVTALIGEGGMGQVYQATDTKLNRQVALKILPEAFATDPDRLARFQREAQVLASLNHPGIAAHLRHRGVRGPEGPRPRTRRRPNPRDRIAKGPIPLDEALPIAKQIAEALEAAHEAGVIHRDLKPANIKVKYDGTVKVLGLRVSEGASQPDASDPALSQSPTISLTAAATQMGMVIGTAAYMAPEQAKGLPVDKRADIWAFGAVLFEMLTGRKLFDAGDVSEMLASVLIKEPDISSIGSHVPAHIRSVLRQCLVKDPKERLRDIGDVRLAMRGAFETTVSAPSVAVDPRNLKVWQRPVPLVAALGLLAITGLAVWSASRPEPIAAPDLIQFVDLPAPVRPANSDGGSYQDLAISPDGTRIIYKGPHPDGLTSQLNLRPSRPRLDAASLRGGRGGFGTLLLDRWRVGRLRGLQPAGTALQKVSIFGGAYGRPG